VVIPDAFVCPITHEVMEDPVFLIADSQTYEKSALDEWFATGRISSPMSGENIESVDYKTNYSLKHAIEVIIRVFFDVSPLHAFIF